MTDRQTEQKQAELDGLTQTVEAVTQATGKPIPKKKKQAADEITALRARNAVLEEEVKRANKDRTDLFREYTKEKRRADNYEETVREVKEIKAVLPDGYAKLLQDVQDEKTARYEKERQRNLARIRGRNKDFARALLPAIQAYFETEEGQKEFEAWQAERQQKQLNNKLNKEKESR